METQPISLAFSWLTLSIGSFRRWDEQETRDAINFACTISGWGVVTLVGISQGNSFLFFAGAGYALMILSLGAIAEGLLVNHEEIIECEEFLGIFLAGLILMGMFGGPNMFRLVIATGATAMLAFAVFVLKQVAYQFGHKKSDGIAFALIGSAFLAGGVGAVLTLLGLA